MLHIVTGSLLEKSRTERANYFGRCGISFQLLEEPIGSMLTDKVHMFLDSVFRTPPGALAPSSVSPISAKGS